MRKCKDGFRNVRKEINVWNEQGDVRIVRSTSLPQMDITCWAQKGILHKSIVTFTHALTSLGSRLDFIFL